MVTRLSGVDVVSLHTQTSTTPAHTLALIIIEASDALSHERLHQLVSSSLPQLARFRSRLRGKPLGIGRPVWAEIDNYDPTSQIHSATVHAPGHRRDFADLIAQLSTPHGGHEPLWQAWSIDGLAGDRWALAVKMSPLLTDGDIGLASILARLLTDGPHDDPTENLPTQPSLGSASAVELITDLVTEVVENNVTGVWLMAEAVSAALEGVRHRLHGSDEIDPMSPAASSMSGPVPDTVFNAPLTKRRAMALASIALADVQAISNAFGGSITNVFLAACTLSLRAWLQRHDTLPDDPLLIQMPLALPAADPTTMRNPSTVGRIRLPVQLDDPVQVLTNLHTATERLNTERRRDAEKAGPTLDFVTIASLIPPAIFHAGMQLYNILGLRKRLARTSHGKVSYKSGRPVVAYCAGGEVIGLHSAAPLVEGCGLNITVTPRGDALDLSVCVCPDNVPAVNDIATGITESVQILVAAAQKSPRGHGRSVVTEIASHATNGHHGGQS